MLVTGHKVLDALEFLKERVKALDSQFSASLYRFEDDEAAQDPRTLIREFEGVNARIARLQEVQAAYNLQVEVVVLGERMTLQRVLQLIACANRVRNLWAGAAAPETQAPFGFGAARARDKDNEYARRVVPLDEARSLAEEAARRALALKQAIRSGNAREVEMDVPEDLFL